MLLYYVPNATQVALLFLYCNFARTLGTNTSILQFFAIVLTNLPFKFRHSLMVLNATFFALRVALIFTTYNRNVRTRRTK